MISAIILAAGESKRMGQPKMLLPWGKETVLSNIINVFRKAGLRDILVITGGSHDRVKDSISHYNIQTIYNKDFTKGEMLSSIQCGIRALTHKTQAILIGLGDQPQVEESSVRMVCEAYINTRSSIVVPSFQMRRGHPWLIARPLWDELLKMESPLSLRDLLIAHHEKIQYVTVDDPGILEDLDTLKDYHKWRP
jgi:molybdenum cofactor cytidylyltransferase